VLLPPLTWALERGGHLARYALKHWAVVASYTSPFGFLQEAMFLLNSRSDLFSAAVCSHTALFLPKVQSHLAEFLDKYSPFTLGALTPAYLRWLRTVRLDGLFRGVPTTPSSPPNPSSAPTHAGPRSSHRLPTEAFVGLLSPECAPSSASPLGSRLRNCLTRSVHGNLHRKPQAFGPRLFAFSLLIPTFSLRIAPSRALTTTVEPLRPNALLPNRTHRPRIRFPLLRWHTRSPVYLRPNEARLVRCYTFIIG
jgi:hypothetical protein